MFGQKSQYVSKGVAVGGLQLAATNHSLNLARDSTREKPRHRIVENYSEQEYTSGRDSIDSE